MGVEKEAGGSSHIRVPALYPFLPKGKKKFLTSCEKTPCGIPEPVDSFVRTEYGVDQAVRYLTRGAISLDHWEVGNMLCYTILIQYGHADGNPNRSIFSGWNWMNAKNVTVTGE